MGLKGKWKLEVAWKDGHQGEAWCREYPWWIGGGECVPDVRDPVDKSIA